VSEPDDVLPPERAPQALSASEQALPGAELAPSGPEPGSGSVAARSDAEPAPASPVSGRAHAWFWLAIGCAIVGAVQVPVALLAQRTATAPVASASAPPPAVSAPSASIAPSIAVSAAPSVSALPEPPQAELRIAQLESEDVEVQHAKVGKRTCVQTLEALGVSPGDLARLATALAPLRKLDGCRLDDRVFVALGRVDKRLRGVELETAPGEMIRVVEKSPADAGVAELVAEKITLPVTHKRFATAFAVATDVPAAIASAGLDASLIEALDEAIGSRHDVSAPTRGSTFRVLADATLVAGTFDRWDEVVAFEYRARPDAAPLRLYHARGKHGWFDPKGHQPVRARWRMPVAFPRITSRFNPKRLHPILKVVMPHNGCDFAAPPGTPVYAIGPGVVTFRGDAGPSGQLVQIAHEGGIESGYAHLSRFAPGVVAGTHVEARTLVGYVGTTGRSTGPHLHLSVKRSGTFVDPLSLKMDAFRVVPPSERSGFASRKLEADLALDAIALPKLDPPTMAPAPAPSTSSSAAPEGEVDLEGEEDEPSPH
jgi:murein DD-endopeptidase MepM/ murein hydrolase activator NlpD